MDRERGSSCPSRYGLRDAGPVGGGPAPTTGGVRPPARRRIRHLVAPMVACALVVLVPSTGILAGRPAGAATTAAPVQAAAGDLTLLSQTAWVTPGQVLDLHLRATAPGVDPAHLGVAVALYPCLSSISAFDQSVTSGPTGTPLAATPAPLAVTGLAPVAGGVDLPLGVAVGTGTTSPAAATTLHLGPTGGQCQSFPSGVYPVRVQLVDTATGAVLASLVTHLVYTEASPSTQRLRVALVLPVQTTVGAAPAPPAADLAARPLAALATPSASALADVTGTVAAVAAQHPTVPVTLAVSGQTVSLLDDGAHPTTLAQLGQLAGTPSVHQLAAAPFTPVNAAGLIGAGLGAELALQVARGVETVAVATGRPPPDPAAGLGPWITGDGLDPAALSALVADGFGQVVLPADAFSSTPQSGSTAIPFTVLDSRGAPVAVLPSDSDLTARFAAAAADPVLAAHQLVAELAQLYYERPNGTSPRVVAAVPPTGWSADPAFVDTLLGALTGNPVAEPVTVAGAVTALGPPAPCRSGCHLLAPAGTNLPVGSIRSQRARVNQFAGAALGAHSLAQQLGDLVLSGEAESLRPVQQAAVLRNAGGAVDAQLGQLVVAGDQTITLTASTGRVPVSIESSAPYPVAGSLTLTSDKLLFAGGGTQWTTNVTVAPHHTDVVYVHVQARASGVFKVSVVLRAPGGGLELAAAELAVRSTATSVVGVVLSAGAIAVLAVWWVRTSLRRRSGRRTEARRAARGGGPPP